MKNSEDRYHSLLDLVVNNIEETFILVDRDLRILLLNIDHIRKLPLINIAEVETGMFLTDVPSLQNRKEAIRKMCEHAFAGNTSESEPLCVLEDGSVRYYHAVYKPARNFSGEIDAVIICARDITELKLAEKKALQQEVTRQRITSQAIIDTQENERTEIGKELHDNVNQILSTIKLYMEMARSNADLKDELIEKSLSNLDAVIEEIRNLSKALTSYSISEMGLITSIRELAESIKLVKTIEINVDIGEFNEDNLGVNQKIMFFRIVQEGLNNIIKHAFATSINISILESDNKILLSIKDNGRGFDVNHTKKGIGVFNIQNRVSMFNGSLLLNAAPGQGCDLRVEIPLVAVGNQ